MADKKLTDSAESEQADTASSITIEQVNQIVNQAISSRFKSFEKKFDDFTAKLAPIDKENQEPNKKEEKLSNAELVKVKQQLEAIQKDRDNEVAKRKDFELRNSVKENLLKSGVAPHMVKAAMAMLVDSDKIIGYNDEDQIIYKTATGDVELTSGLKDWVKTEEGKAFVAPKGAIGSGEKTFGKAFTPNSNVKPSRQEVGNMLEEALLTGMKNQ